MNAKSLEYIKIRRHRFNPRIKIGILKNEAIAINSIDWRLKEDLDTLLSYSKESKINSQNISQYLSSELNDSESLKNKDSNEIIEH